MQGCKIAGSGALNRLIIYLGTVVTEDWEDTGGIQPDWGLRANHE